MKKFIEVESFEDTVYGITLTLRWVVVILMVPDEEHMSQLLLWSANQLLKLFQSNLVELRLEFVFLVLFPWYFVLNLASFSFDFEYIEGISENCIDYKFHA